MAEHTFCRTCHRVVWVKDVDEDGDCVDHQDEKRREAKAKAKAAGKSASDK